MRKNVPHFHQNIRFKNKSHFFSWSFYNYIKEGGREGFHISNLWSREIGNKLHAAHVHHPLSHDLWRHTRTRYLRHTHTSIVILSHLHTLSHICLLLCQMSDNGCFVFLLQVSLYLLCKTLSDSSNVFDSSRLS